MENIPQLIALFTAAAVCVITLALAFAVIAAIFTDKINLSHLLSESTAEGTATTDAKASLSRFQALVFTFVVAGLYLVLSLETGTLIDVPAGTLLLLGISSSTYVLGKVIKGKEEPGSTTTGPKAPDNSQGTAVG